MTKTIDFNAEKLKRIEKKLDEQKTFNQEIKLRFSELDHGLAIIKSEAANTYGILARIQVSLDKIDTRLSRIETRLDLTI